MFIIVDSVEKTTKTRKRSIRIIGVRYKKHTKQTNKTLLILYIDILMNNWKIFDKYFYSKQIATTRIFYHYKMIAKTCTLIEILYMALNY